MALAPLEGNSIVSFSDAGLIPLVVSGTAASHWSSSDERVLLLLEYHDPAWLAFLVGILDEAPDSSFDRALWSRMVSFARRIVVEMVVLAAG